jgi:hypothetical protein
MESGINPTFSFKSENVKKLALEPVAHLHHIIFRSIDLIAKLVLYNVE